MVRISGYHLSALPIGITLWQLLAAWHDVDGVGLILVDAQALLLGLIGDLGPVVSVAWMVGSFAFGVAVMTSCWRRWLRLLTIVIVVTS